MKRPARAHAALAAAVTAIALATAAAPALADGGFTLSLTPQSEAVVGRTLTIQATGTTPPDQIWFNHWLSVVWIPTSVTTTCPQTQAEGFQFATQNGGGVIVPAERQSPDATGSFSMPIAVTPSAAGEVLICGYTDDNEGGTLARASLTLRIAQGSSSGGGPQPTGGDTARSIPAEVARGIRMCRALFSPAGSKRCIRNLVRDANAHCRKLQSKRGRTRCVRSVRRVVRRNA